MKRTRYTRYNGDLGSEIDLEELLEALSDYFLDSGFSDPYSPFGDLEHSLDNLREALRRALQNGSFFDQQIRQKIDQLALEGRLEELIEQLLKRMETENYIRSQAEASVGQGEDGPGGNARFEVTDKSLDFLGFKTLRDLLGSLGRSSCRARQSTISSASSSPTAHGSAFGKNFLWRCARRSTATPARPPRSSTASR